VTIGSFKGDSPESFGHGVPPCLKSTQKIKKDLLEIMLA
jgi:hypothetical protein